MGDQTHWHALLVAMPKSNLVVVMAVTLQTPFASATEGGGQSNFLPGLDGEVVSEVDELPGMVLQLN
ncbi:hypothetical protein D3C76_844200 [compost metagenome]|uniref:hypothetical protein n=1 Tax=Pseudomonas TaxID=286 RepID=UPI000F9D7D3D|nr:MULTISPECIES: hypothetical protein [unclassified Pseudomonas]MDH0302265.1 hypothetical protein [Pseudomonas sp. GD04091]MDH1986004.1 hypothetical protein [Pseudomonas sp. GD03689]